jgi:hypothetical protein
MDTSTTQFLAQYPTRLNLAPSLPQNRTTSTGSSPTLDSNDMAPPMSTSAVDDKTKRLTACLVCRKRKLKCDSARPKCASCARLGHAWYPCSDLNVNSTVAMKRLGKNLVLNKDMSRNWNRNHKPSNKDLLNWRNSLLHIRVTNSRYPRQRELIFLLPLEYPPFLLKTSPLPPPLQPMPSISSLHSLQTPLPPDSTPVCLPHNPSSLTSRHPRT